MARFKRHRHHHGRHKNSGRHKRFNFRNLRWILIIALLVGAYIYNKSQIFFGMGAVYIGFLNMAVSGLTYWVGVLVLCAIIYFIFDRL